MCFTIVKYRFVKFTTFSSCTALYFCDVPNAIIQLPNIHTQQNKLIPPPSICKKGGYGFISVLRSERAALFAKGKRGQSQFLMRQAKVNLNVSNVCVFVYVRGQGGRTVNKAVVSSSYPSSPMRLLPLNTHNADKLDF